MDQRIPGQSPGVPPVSVHFVNNVLAAAASYIEEDPDTARDVLAELGAFLSHRLRGRAPVSPAEELDHVGVYLRLEQARFPDRIDVELPDRERAALDAVGAGDVQAPLSEALSRWMASTPGRCASRCAPAATRWTSSSTGPTRPGKAGERRA